MFVEFVVEVDHRPVGLETATELELERAVVAPEPESIVPSEAPVLGIRFRGGAGGSPRRIGMPSVADRDSRLRPGSPLATDNWLLKIFQNLF